MNSKQQAALLLGLVALVMIWVVPPWQHVDSDGAAKSMGYSPLWSPPVKTESQGANILGFKLELKESEQANAIDWQTLIGEGGVVVLTTAAAIALCGMKKPIASTERKIGSPVA